MKWMTVVMHVGVQRVASILVGQGSFKTVQHLFCGNRQGPSGLWRLLCKEYERPGIIFLTCSGVSVLLGFDDFSPIWMRNQIYPSI